MKRRKAVGTVTAACGLAGLLVLTAPRSLRSQDSAAALLKDALAKVQANRLDSATALLRRVIDTLVPAARAERAEAWVLLGVTRFYGGRDSLAAVAFREAFLLDPDLEVAGLAQLDPDIERLLAVAHGAVTRSPPRAAGRDEPRLPEEPVHDCRGGCKTGEEPPHLRFLPPVDFLDVGSLGLSGRRGQVVIEAVISEQGRVELQSVKVLSSSSRELDRFLERVLRELFYRPASFQGQLIRVLVELRFDFRVEGTNQVTYQIRGP